MKVLLVTHTWSHTLSGGAENSSSNLATALRRAGHAVQLVACVPDLDQEVGYDAASDVVLIRSGTLHGSYTWGDPRTADRWARLVTAFAPDIVHLHHYVNAGAELAMIAKRAAPGCAVLLTLHEYLAICRKNGQMVLGQSQLCEGSGPRKCAACTSTPIEVVVENEMTLKAVFRHVDRFIAPSIFLLERYVAWGIDRERIKQLPNVVRVPSLTPRAAHTGAVTRFAFMSQHTPYKGLDVLLDALLLIEERHPKAVERAAVDIWGSGIERFGEHWSERIAERQKRLGNWVAFRGAYTPEQTDAIYSGVDWTLVPSIWWENRPLVIEESMAAGVPVITSSIGGMSELVNGPGLGMTCPPNDPFALAAAIIEAIDTPRLAVRYEPTTTADAHVRLYRTCLGLADSDPDPRG